MKAEAGTLFPRVTFNVNRTRLPLVMLGDSTYSLMSWLIKLFPNWKVFQQMNNSSSRNETILE